MSILLIIILMFWLFISLKSGKIGAIVFNSVWLLSVVINMFCSDILYEPSLYSIVLLSLFAIFVNLGLLSKIKITAGSKFNSVKSNYQELNTSRFIIVNILASIYFIYKYTLKSIALTKQYGVFETRYAAYNAGALGTTADLYIAQQFIYGIFYMSMIISLIELVKSKNKKRGIIIGLVGILEMLLYSFTFKGRSSIIAVFFYAVVVFASTYAKRKDVSSIKQKKKTKRLLVLLGVALLVYFISLSLDRFGGISNLKKYVVIYCGGSITYFSELIKENNPTYEIGKYIFCGVLDFFKLATNILLHTNLDLGGNSIGLMIDGATSIGGDLTINAMCTAPFYMYFEGGIIGVIIYSFVLGMLCSMIERRYKADTNNYLFYIMYIMSIYFLFYTYSGWAYKYFYFFAIPFVARIFYKNRKVVVQNEI